MGEVTRAEFNQLRERVEETYWLTRGVLQSWVGREKADEFAESVKGYWGPDVESERYRRMFREPDGIVRIQLSQTACEALFERDCVTLPEIAEHPRREIARITGVGRVSLARLDQALADRGMTWAEAS